MTQRMRFACCVLLAACGSAPLESSEPAPDGGEPCAGPLTGVGYPHVLLRIGCNGELLPGRAVWARDGTAVTLEFREPAGGPTGAALVEAWPLLSEPPWLGHRVEGITVLSGGRVRVRFGEMPGGSGTEPERLFADHRLSGVPFAPREGDARDAIDAGQPVLTRHDASIEYARLLGRPVQMVGFDQLYLVVFAGEEEAAGLGRAIGADWAQWGAEMARRAAAVSWTALTDRCGASPPAADTNTVRSRPNPSNPTVSYPEGDLPGLQIAERIVSAMRGNRPGPTALTGSASRLSVRPAEEPRPGRARSDVAAVFRVQSGPGHPCSLYAEVLHELEEWVPSRAATRWRVLLIGETAVFEIAQAAPSVRKDL